MITLIEDTLDISNQEAEDLFYSVVDYYEMSRCSNCNCMNTCNVRDQLVQKNWYDDGTLVSDKLRVGRF